MAFGQFSGQIASHIEVLEFIAKLPKVHTRVLFEITQVRFSSESFWGLGTAALFFGLFGLGW
jgi:hypothetical protein